MASSLQRKPPGFGRHRRSNKLVPQPSNVTVGVKVRELNFIIIS
jgi:hypothetical protein